MTKNHILLVDDDEELVSLLAEYLVNDGFEIATATSGVAALSLSNSHRYDAIVLDIMMPEMSGLEVLRELRQTSSVPIIMLTGRGDDIDRIVGLELGADDYLGKPCNPRELAARIRAVLRRTQPQREELSLGNTKRSHPMILHGICLNTATMVVEINNQEASLTGAEFKLLQLLLESAGKMLNKNYLTEQTLNRKLTVHDRSIDVHISRLRQKLKSHGVDPQVIKAIRGTGYQMLVESPDKLNHPE